MTERLLQRFDEAVSRAARFRSGADPDPVLDALGYALWLSVLGELDRVRPDRLDTLRAVGRRALLGLGAAGDGTDTHDTDDADDADDAERQATDQISAQLHAIARAGLQALGGTPKAPNNRVRLHPPDHTLSRMLHGDTNGITAGRYAAHILACTHCQQSLEALHLTQNLLHTAPLAAAAAATASIRPPANGRILATHNHPALEAVVFDDHRLALYADSHAPLRLVADGITTEETLGGYWLGRLDEGVERLEATVHLGSEVVRWIIDLGG